MAEQPGSSRQHMAEQPGSSRQHMAEQPGSSRQQSAEQPDSSRQQSAVASAYRLPAIDSLIRLLWPGAANARTAVWIALVALRPFGTVLLFSNLGAGPNGLAELGIGAVRNRATPGVTAWERSVLLVERVRPMGCSNLAAEAQEAGTGAAGPEKAEMPTSIRSQEWEQHRKSG